MVDPSLIIYHPVRQVGEVTVVTNGDQTDTIRDSLLAGKSYIDALRTRCYEPTAPTIPPASPALSICAAAATSCPSSSPTRQRRERAAPDLRLPAARGR